MSTKKKGKGAVRAKARKAARDWSIVRIVGALQKLHAEDRKEDIAVLLKRMGVSLKALVHMNTYLLGLDSVSVQGLGQGPIGMVIDTSGDGVKVPKRRQAYATGALVTALGRMAAFPKRDLGLAVGGLEILATASVSKGPILQDLAARLRAEAKKPPVVHDSDPPMRGRMPEGIQLQYEMASQAVREGRELRFHYRAGTYKPVGGAKRRCEAYDVTVGSSGEYMLVGLDPEQGRDTRFFKLNLMFQPELGDTFTPFTPEQIKMFMVRGTNTRFERSAPASEVWAREDAARALARGALRATPLKGGKQPSWLKGTGWQSFNLRYHKERDLTAALIKWIPDVSVAGPKSFRDEWVRAMNLLKRVY